MKLNLQCIGYIRTQLPRRFYTVICPFYSIVFFFSSRFCSYQFLCLVPRSILINFSFTVTILLYYFFLFDLRFSSFTLCTLSHPFFYGFIVSFILVFLYVLFRR